MSIRHDELGRLLASHLRSNSDRMVWVDMQLGSAGSPRPDVYTINKSDTSLRPLAYEVKVSKADYRQDVAKGKWQTYLPFCCAVIFAVPHGLITKADLPSGCGLMTWNGAIWHTAKAPTLNPLPSLSRDMMMKLLIDGIDRASSHHRVQAKPKWDSDRAIRQKYGAVVAEAVAKHIDFDDWLKQLEKKYADAKLRAQESHDADLKRIRETETSNRSELAKVLGLAPDCSIWDIRGRIRLLTEAVNRDEEDRELRRHLANIQDALNAANNSPAVQIQKMIDG